MKKDRFILIFLGLFLITNLNAQNRNKRYKPKDLEESITQLGIIFPDSTKNNIFNLTEEEFVKNTHLTTGMWIRNNWGLWRKRELAKYFNTLGIFHPDDMSGIILTSYYRHLHNQDLKVEEQIEYHKEYWRKSYEYNYRLENDTAFYRQEKIKQENLYQERNEELKLKFPVGSQVKVWAEYNAFGARSQVIGEIIDWRATIRKGSALTPKGTLLEIEYIEAKIKIIQFLDITKKEGIENQTRRTNNELWVNANSIREIEDDNVQQNFIRITPR